MKLFLALLVAFSSAFLVIASPAAAKAEQSGVASEKQGITQGLYEELVWYWKYAISANAESCPFPHGNVLVKQINQPTTDTQGYIARDDHKKEIVVVFRGTSSLEDAFTDLLIILIPFKSPGVNAPPLTLVHTGFLKGWNSVAIEVISSVQAELAAYPGYTIVASGHSLGGALASIAAIALKQNFPDVPLKMFTYGQPRVGNRGYANFVNDQVGVDNIFRSVHANDGVPTIIPRVLGYRHHATEYWQNPDPSSPSTVKKCDGLPTGEDPSCSNQIPSGGLNSAHSTYYGIKSNNTFCLQREN